VLRERQAYEREALRAGNVERARRLTADMWQSLE
jgi:hypothetical protein